MKQPGVIGSLAHSGGGFWDTPPAAEGGSGQAGGGLGCWTECGYLGGTGGVLVGPGDEGTEPTNCNQWQPTNTLFANPKGAAPQRTCTGQVVLKVGRHLDAHRPRRVAGAGHADVGAHGSLQHRKGRGRRDLGLGFNLNTI